ncbi:SGNH/GDSL hydrolase family protein [Streptomyces sp. NBC_01136]|uniref:SGNH/GDSL hydrolase family protein n=1 Tax=unclassified Streptomyces TaxID=2593676 RepID=UPI003249133F|nr:SGNH/GDSL hydrolase family protein [Streptomyces sp. NBC_01136]
MACAALAGGLLQAAPATAAPKPSPGRSHATPPTPPSRVTNPDSKLGKGWNTSQDRAVTAAADTDGLHVLVADSAKAYEWKTATVLSEPGLPADSWIGNQCVIDHQHAAVVYAPRSFTNKPDLMQGGAFAAIVNLDTGHVTKLPFTASLAYFDPSCNPDTHTAVFTAYRDMNDPESTKTRVVTVNTAGNTTGATVTSGEVTSAVPVQDGTVAARGRRLVHIDRSGTVKNLTTADTVPFDIRPAAHGQIAFVDRSGNTTAHAKLFTGHGRLTVIASGELGELDLSQGPAGRVFLTGHPIGALNTQGTGVIRINAPAATDISTLGRLAVNPVLTPGVHAGLARVKNAGKGFAKAEPSPQDQSAQAPETVTSDAATTVTSIATTTGEEISQSVQDDTADAKGTPASAGKSIVSPALTAGGQGGKRKRLMRTAAAVSNTPVDTDRWCAVSRNDVTAQALQPTPNQVEWAVDMAVRGKLRSDVIRQGGYRNQTGLSTIDPQGAFPPPTLNGGDGKGRIPANVLLGIMAQESNLWQAEGGSIPGQMGNPLAAVDGYYGHKAVDGDPDSIWRIHWDKSDCGYGVGQVTDGMRLAGLEKPGEKSLSPALQKAVAVDYATNIAASMKILADKWNEVHTAGQAVAVNNDDPSMVENWFTAVWNYNLGFNPPSDASKHDGHWGLGWFNNPANPLYKKSWNHPFMDTSVDGTEANHDAAHPQDWPYEEKVMGWAAWSIDTGFSYGTDGRQDWPGESGFSSAGFRPAWWTTPAQRSLVSPPLSTFCNGNNNCDPNTPPDCTTEACYAKYWWNRPNATWKSDCATSCGHENIKYQTVIPEPGRGYRLKNGSPVCVGAPTGATVVASVPNKTESWGDCGQVTSSGDFQFTFYPDPNATGPGLGPYEAKADLHQVGGGYGGHFWYAHTRNKDHLGGDNGYMTIKGTWTLGQSADWARVFVQLPDTGTQTQQAHYVIHGVAGGDRDRYLNTHYGKSTWAELGVYHFTGTPSVELSNSTDDGTADDDIAWGAVAFQKLADKPKHMVVAMGDSYSSGEGAGDYSPESNTSHGTSQWNGCRRSNNSWPRKVILPFNSSTIGQLADANDSSIDFQNVTCSGAHTWQLTSGNPTAWGVIGNYHEKSQIDSGVLSADTSLVMLTIGGNDSNNFTNAVTDCYIIGVCNASDYTGKVDQAVTDTGTVLSEIASAAPNAQIVLMDYPHIVNNAPCLPANFDALNYLADYVRDKQKAKVDELQKAGIKVAFADAIPAFKGHGICDTDEWINKIVAGPNGDGDFHQGDPANQIPCIPVTGICVSLESFHPKNAGTTAYAQVMDQKLADIGYKGG